MFSADTKEKLAAAKQKADAAVTQGVSVVASAVDKGVNKARTWQWVNKMEAFGQKIEKAVKKAVHKVSDKIQGPPREELPDPVLLAGYLNILDQHRLHAEHRWCELRGTKLYLSKYHSDRHFSHCIDLTRVTLMFTYVTPALTSALKIEDDQGSYVFMEMFGMPAGVIDRWYQTSLHALRQANLPTPPVVDPARPVLTPPIIPPGTMPEALEYVPVPQLDGSVLTVPVAHCTRCHSLQTSSSGTPVAPASLHGVPSPAATYAAAAGNPSSSSSSSVSTSSVTAAGSNPTFVRSSTGAAYDPFYLGNNTNATTSSSTTSSTSAAAAAAAPAPARSSAFGLGDQSQPLGEFLQNNNRNSTGGSI